MFVSVIFKLSMCYQNLEQMDFDSPFLEQCCSVKHVLNKAITISSESILLLFYEKKEVICIRLIFFSRLPFVFGFPLVSLRENCLRIHGHQGRRLFFFFICLWAAIQTFDKQSRNVFSTRTIMYQCQFRSFATYKSVWDCRCSRSLIHIFGPWLFGIISGTLSHDFSITLRLRITLEFCHWKLFHEKLALTLTF